MRGMTRLGANLQMQLKLIPLFLVKESESNSGEHVDMENLSSLVVKITNCGSSKQKREAVKVGDPNPRKGRPGRRKGDLYLSGKYTCINMHNIPIKNLGNVLEGS